MSVTPVVSIVTIFLDEAEFLEEAVRSVFAQTFTNWELLLVDDGSTDASSEIARRYAQEFPGKVRYFEHPGHANLGMSASRNLGLQHALGNYLAFLDADDVWLEHKLACQVPRLEAQPDLGMTYGVTQYWHSWTGLAEDRALDHYWRPGVDKPTVFDPPTLLPLFITDKIRMPCMGGILCRRQAVIEAGGWEESFRGLYEDQVFFAKLCLTVPIELTDEWLDRYRQHPQSACAVGSQSGELPRAQHLFFQWLSAEMSRRHMEATESWIALQLLLRSTTDEI